MNVPLASWLLLAAGSGIAGAGLLAQLRVSRLREAWRREGHGLEEPGTGLLTLAAVPVRFDADVATAAACDRRLALVVLRRLTADADGFARNVAAALRAHEDAWRVDYDVVAASMLVVDHDDAVRAAGRLASRLAPDGATDLRIGIAIAGDDGDDFLDLVDVGMRRLRAASIYVAVAAQLADEPRGCTGS